MPLELLATLVPLGIALVVLVVKFSGLSYSATLQDEKHTITQFLLDFPSEVPTGDVLISTDAKAAFLTLSNTSTIALVEAIGDRFLTRIVSPSDIKNIQMSAGQLKVHFRDFTHPHATYDFAQKVDAERILNWLQSGNAKGISK